MFLRRNGKKQNDRTDPNELLQWDLKHVVDRYRDPQLLIVDLRSSGVFRGGPPANPKEVPTEYHQGHVFLALNLNLSNVESSDEIEQEIYTGANSAGGTFLDTLVLAISSDFHFLFYNQDGSGMEILNVLKDVPITYHGETFFFNEERMHWVKGGYENIHKSNALGRYCADTKTLIGIEEEIEEPEYSEVLPFLFVGGAVCSETQYNELKSKGVKRIVNVSNVQREPHGFDCTFIYADDDQVEQLSRIFEQVANLIEEAEKSGEGVFVHCQRGLSRSPTLVMAYLMMKKGHDLRTAYEYVKGKRASIGPRSNFMAQLCRLETKLTADGTLQLSNTDGVLKYSLPMQVYELSCMNCANYEEGVQFLLKPARKRNGVCASVMSKYRDIKASW